MALAVFDIDGVVADVRHRLHHLDRRRNGRKDWRAFFAAAPEDPLLPAGAEVVADLARDNEIVWLTGRPGRLRRATREWLAAHDLPGEELHMRPDGDFRPARIYKLEVLRRLSGRQIAAFVDDDPEVVDVALRAGFAAVLADWIPRHAVLRTAQERDGRT